MPEPLHLLATKLAQHISGDVRFDYPTRLIYSTDASNYQVMPLGVVLPKTTGDVVATMTLCAEHNISIVPRGGGSSLCGSAIGPGLVIDFTKYMDALLEVDVAAQTARTQPGLILGQLNKKLAAMGLQFGPDPASAERAAVGGVIGNNATGSHSITYGMSADNVLAVQAVLADGALVEFGADENNRRNAESAQQNNNRLRDLLASAVKIVRTHESAIRRDYPKVWRRASGYNLDFIAEMLAYDEANPTAALTPANALRQGENLANHLRQISQFNLAPLFAGAEGSLGIMTEMTLNLVPKPRHTALVITSFESLIDSMRAVPALLSTQPTALELIGGMFIDLAKDLPECRHRMGWVDLSRGVPEGLLVIEYSGESAAAVRDSVAHLQQVVDAEHFPCTLKPLFDAKSQADVWHIRKQGLTVLTSIRSQFKPISVVEDVAVPVERLPEYVERLRAIFKLNNTDGAFYAHASAGVLHVRPLVNLKTADGLSAMQDIGRRTLDLCRELGGAMSGEHGDGYERSHQNEALFGPQVYNAFCELKDAFDPRGLLNPGKKVRGYTDVDMEAHMRLGPHYKTAPMQTTFTFHMDGSFAGTVEQCNGSGVCRKLDGGVMCPSYRATREEMHSTRGRANMLRAFIAEKKLEIGASRLISNLNSQISTSAKPSVDEVKAALDLCLSCKACATECAAGVDMSKLKSEFVAHIYEERGTPLRAWLLGRIGLLSGFASALGPLSNWMLRQPLFKRVLHVAPERVLPAFTSHTFDKWWKRRKNQEHIAQKSEVRSQTSDGRRQEEGTSHQTHDSDGQSKPKRVALFVDTFNRYNHPQVAIAAVRVLEHYGYEVIVPPWKCCGRPMLSQGQPKAMLEWARFNVATLAPLAKQGIPILGLEPSCISAFTDDYIDLLPGDDTRAVAKMTMSVEEFLMSHLSSSIAEGGTSAQPKMKDEKSSIVFHGHCHQKAHGSTGGTKQALAQAGCDVHEIDSTCCGMAGAFGYEAEHYDISQRVGELALLPAVRSASTEATIVAAGTSCRDQIRHFTGREVLHPVEVLARQLDANPLPAETEKQGEVSI